VSLNIGELVAYAKVDYSGVGKGITGAQQEMRRGMDRVSADARAGGEKAGRSAGDGLVGGFKGSVGKLTGIVVGAFAVEKVVSGLRAAKDAASDLNETTSMAGVIFGQNKAAMEEFARTGPRALGLSTEATLRQSAALADMLQQIGYTEGGAASASKSIVQMAADLGSFKNLRTEDVLDRISAGFRGEYDSLQLLIPNISAARVQQEAMAATGKKNADSLTAQEKAAATLAIIQKDGVRASGDFARTRNGEANASKTAAAATEDLRAKIGQGLLPAYTAMVVFGRDKVIPFLSETVDRLGDAADATKPLAGDVGDLVGEFRNLPQPVQTATLSLIALVALRSRVEALGTGIQTRVTNNVRSASSALDTMRLHMLYAADSADSGGSRFTGMAKAIGTSAGAGVRGAATGLLGLLGGPWGIAFAGAVTVVTLFLNKQAEARQVADDLRDSLDKQTGAVTENTRVKLAQRLQDEGLLDVTASLGLSMKDVTEAAAGNAAKLEDLRRRQQELANQGAAATLGQLELGASLTGVGKGADDLKAGLGGASTATAGQAAQLQRILDFITPLNSALRTQSDNTKQVAEAADVGADASKGLATATDDSTGKIKDQADAARDAAKAVLELADAQLRASGETIGYQDALAAVDDRLQKRKELEAELAKAGGISDRTKKLQERADEGASDRTRRLQRDLAEATTSKKRASIERQLSDSQAADAKRLGKVRSDLADSRAKDAKKSSDEIARLRKELAEYTGGVDLSTEAGRENQKVLNDLAESARGKSKADLEAGVSLKSLRDNMANARKDFIESAVRLGVSKKAAEAMATQFGLTKTDVDNLAKSVEDLPASKQIVVEAETQAAATALATLKAQLAGLNDKGVVVTAIGRFVNTGPLSNGGRSTAGGQTINEANGGVVKYYGDGAHVAQHVAAGSWRVFGEPETGGETYIPHAPSKRARSTAILAETADMFGYGLVPKSVTNTTTTNAPIHIAQVVTNDWAKLEREARDRRRRANLGRRRAR
jgi:hypothetical protein